MGGQRTSYNAPNENVHAMVKTIEDLIERKLNLLKPRCFIKVIWYSKIEDGSFLVTYEGLKHPFKTKAMQVAGSFSTSQTKPTLTRPNGQAQAEGGVVLLRNERGTRADLFFEDLGFDHITAGECIMLIISCQRQRLERVRHQFSRFSIQPPTSE